MDTATDVPGEVLYPTQPFPTKPPPFSGQGVSLEDANDLTPEIHTLAVEEMQRFRLGPAVHPAEPSRDAAAPWRERRRELGRGGVRPRDGAAVRAHVGRRQH